MPGSTSGRGTSGVADLVVRDRRVPGLSCDRGASKAGDSRAIATRTKRVTARSNEESAHDVRAVRRPRSTSGSVLARDGALQPRDPHHQVAPNSSYLIRSSPATNSDAASRGEPPSAIPGTGRAVTGRLA